MRITILGLSITSSWGDGHATNYRGLVRELVRRGHEVTFLERDVSWYYSNRDMPNPPFGTLHLYNDLDDLKTRFTSAIAEADAVIIGSYVAQGPDIERWVMRTATGATAFYDLDTPVTLAKLRRNDYEYLAPELIPQFDVYLSFTGGPVLDKLENVWGSPRAIGFYCMVDPELYHPLDVAVEWDLGYLGTYSIDRQPTLERLLLDVARRERGQFVVAGPEYPPELVWPKNVQRIQHLPPSRHGAFYNAQCFTLNVTRHEMIHAGFAPSVRLFEAAACGVPIISDRWNGLDTFFAPDSEILIADTTADVVAYLWDMPEAARFEIGRRARERVLNAHTAARRAEELERHLNAARVAAAT